jgi:hypothetical protein
MHGGLRCATAEHNCCSDKKDGFHIELLYSSMEPSGEGAFDEDQGIANHAAAAHPMLVTSAAATRSAYRGPPAMAATVQRVSVLAPTASIAPLTKWPADKFPAA